MTAAGLARDCRGTGAAEVLEGPQFAPVRQLRQSPIRTGQLERRRRPRRNHLSTPPLPRHRKLGPRNAARRHLQRAAADRGGHRGAAADELGAAAQDDRATRVAAAQHRLLAAGEEGV